MSFHEVKADDEDLYDILSLSPPGAKPTALDAQLGSQFMKFDSPYQQHLQHQPHHNFAPDHPYESFDVYQVPTTKAPPFHRSANVNLTTNTLSVNTQNLPGPGNANSTPSPSTELLSPTNFSNHNNTLTSTSSFHNSTHSSTNLLDPRSPSALSSHSLYSDAPSNPASPYLDASSHFSANPPAHLSAAAVSNFGGVTDSNYPGVQYLDTDPNTLNTFDTEIALGGSISNTNLVGLDPPAQQVPPTLHADPLPPQFNYSVNNQPMSLEFSVPNLAAPGAGVPQSLPDTSSKLTENNLINYNNSIKQQQPSISIHQAPQDVAAQTPSLFSNSSANSSIHNSPRANGEISRQHTGNQPGGAQAQKYNGVNSLIPNSHLVYSGANSAHSSTLDVNQGGLLKPDEFQSIRRGRKKSHSSKSLSRPTSRSRSSSQVKPEDDPMGDDEDDEESYEYDDYDDDEEAPTGPVSSREKMLELASPSKPAKRTQKHPSVYACHLCEKRFTRPYNLKSHLRTHTDERPFICNACGKAFARQHDRKRHEELHTGEKKFQCKGFLKDGSPYGCGRKFARADALRRHFQTENGKACIRLLIEEEELERQRNGGTGPPITAASVKLDGEFGDDGMSASTTSTNGYLTPNSASMPSIPQVAISPPD